MTGRCDNGCADGWIGIYCEKSCIYGSYGPGCAYNCSGHCLNDTFCNKQTGHCDAGCEPGYTGNLCNKECISGLFGPNCTEHCSQNCRNDEICNHIDGVCTNGCKNGYIGEKCNQTCDHGYFGNNCSGVCSQKCISLCELKDGFCDCVHGWKGSNCSEKCPFGNYGINCEGKCSLHCGFNDSCDIYEGTCPRGCQEPYTGSNCSQLPSDLLHPISTRDSILPIPMPWFLGITLSGVLNLCLMLGICVINCRACSRKKCNTVSSQNTQSSSYISNERGISSYDIHHYQELRNSKDGIHYQEITSI
ncbi:multiple epidermal growth factor-like domains protein 10 [Saccostrea cucullata]|uniref:multiple epidermal growth factor-like domains protein 10 n=1 Tax=Saccostrea cuccullata TaxID=36930 RepID=UPI002ED0B204